MAAVTLTKVRESKNGLVLYKAGRQRVDGNIYIDRKCFENGSAPDTLVVDAEGFKAAAPKPERKAKETATETAETTEASAQA